MTVSPAANRSLLPSGRMLFARICGLFSFIVFGVVVFLYHETSWLIQAMYFFGIGIFYHFLKLPVAHSFPCSPHSVLLWPDQRPARKSSPSETGRVHGAHPMLG